MQEETIEKKLRVLKALKKSQELVVRVCQENKKERGEVEHLREVEGKSILVEKLRPRKGK